MPIVKVFTNLARNQLPVDFMPKFNGFLAAALSKDPKLFKWTLDTDKLMSQVREFSKQCQPLCKILILQGCDVDGHRKPFLFVEIESVAVFDTKEKCHKIVPEIFKYLQNETALKNDQIVTKFRDLQAHHVGSKGITLDQK